MTDFIYYVQHRWYVWRAKRPCEICKMQSGLLPKYERKDYESPLVFVVRVWRFRGEPIGTIAGVGAELRNPSLPWHRRRLVGAAQAGFCELHVVGERRNGRHPQPMT